MIQMIPGNWLKITVSKIGWYPILSWSCISVLEISYMVLWGDNMWHSVEERQPSHVRDVLWSELREIFVWKWDYVSLTQTWRSLLAFGAPLTFLTAKNNFQLPCGCKHTNCVCSKSGMQSLHSCTKPSTWNILGILATTIIPQQYFIFEASFLENIVTEALHIPSIWFCAIHSLLCI